MFYNIDIRIVFAGANFFAEARYDVRIFVTKVHVPNVTTNVTLGLVLKGNLC